jgi:hypothetical protein
VAGWRGRLERGCREDTRDSCVLEEVTDREQATLVSKM